MLVMYGIRNCDTVRKARRWLEARGIEYHWHDVRDDGLDRTRLQEWTSRIPCQKLLNRRSATWRALSESERRLETEDDCLRLLEAHPTLLRRPVVEHPQGLLVGFDPQEWSEALQ